MTEPTVRVGCIRATHEDLATEEVRVMFTRGGHADGLRWAELHLEPEGCIRLVEGEQSYIVSWNEEDG